jgi:C4-dicarboxylate-specific signal transduction histidine kinase
MIIDALRKKYEAEIAAAKANIEVYNKNPAGIGEHPDLVQAVDTEMVKLADAEDKLETLNKHYGNQRDLLT